MENEEFVNNKETQKGMCVCGGGGGVKKKKREKNGRDVFINKINL